MKQRSLFVVSILIVATALLAGCRGEQREGTWLEPRTENITTATPEPQVAAGATAIVMLQDGLITVPAEPLAPGPTVFTVENRGTEVHSLHIEGEGAERAAENPIAAGETTSLDITLSAGTYTVYCPVLDHRTKGEEAQFTVEGPDTGAV